jgi:hypothetical protein
MRDARSWSRSCARVAGAVFVAMAASACGQGPDTEPGSTASTPPAPTKKGLQSVWGSADDDIWAVGDGGTILRFDGHAWTFGDAGVTENLTSVYGTGPDDVWVTGDGGSLLHWDGKAWMAEPASVVTPDATLLGVWTGAAGDVWAVGVDFDASALGGGSGFVRHLAAGVWSDSDVPASGTLWKVWGSGPTDVWLVGSEQGAGLIYRGNGMDFEPMDFTGDAVHGIWGSGPDDVWVAPSTGPIQHWTGSAWASAPPLGVGQALYGMSGSGPDDVWAVGDKGVVGHYVAGHWAVSPAPTTETLFGVWSRTPTHAWLVGGKATALRWDGSGWK